MTIQSQLAEIKERLSRATPGPWIVPEYDKADYCFKLIAQVEITPKYQTQVTPVTMGDVPMALLIAHAPTDLSRLIRALEVADAALARYSALKAFWPVACKARAEILSILKGAKE